ncbi:hypothetical protein VTJ04DRAFT_7115 [Mycothermus thermophilus]|uniref:uncharacterized protein n=1 Tax=Humicola insolens TaxID=85995 RepID=UPI0037436F5B
MRIRLPFAGGFTALLLLAAYLGLTPSPTDPDATPVLPFPFNDKGLHFLTFLILTLVFYWVIDTTRRRALNLTLLVCTLGLGFGSEVLQGLLPNGREFDLLDVVTNVFGSLLGVALCAWYHRRMLERRRRKKYTAVPTEGGEGEHEGPDLELGEGVGRRSDGGQEEGVTTTTATTTTTTSKATPATTLDDAVDNWDENAEDAWSEDDEGDVGGSAPAAAAGKPGSGEGKKRAD